MAAVVVVLLGALGAFALVRSDDDDADTAATTTTTTTTTTAVLETTTSAPGATSSTTAAATTTTAARATTTTAPRTTTTTGVVAACGSGKATVSFTAKDLATDAISSTFVPQATVDNQVSVAIEVDDVTLEVSYPNGEVRTVHFATAGTVIGPGTTASFTSDKLTSAQRYSSVRFTRFAYFSEGNKASCLVTTT